MFKLDLENDASEYFNELCYKGMITIGDWQEVFYSPSIFWKREDYLKSWKREIKKILDNKSNNAKLFTTMYNPKIMNFCRAWTLYVVKSKVYVHEQIFFVDDFKSPFTLKQLFDLNLKRETIDEDGNEISEWEITRDELNDFYIRL